jgi:hypothetical protein
MSVTPGLCGQLTGAGEDKTRVKPIAEAFEHLEDRCSQVKDVATAGQVRETGLRQQKEIEEGEVCLTQAIHRQTLGVVGSVGDGPAAGMVPRSPVCPTHGGTSPPNRSDTQAAMFCCSNTAFSARVSRISVLTSSAHFPHWLQASRRVRKVRRLYAP